MAMSTTPETLQWIQTILSTTLQATDLVVEDDSRLHAGHQSTGGHYRVDIASPLFVGKTPLQQHRLVYDALATEMGAGIHALALKTRLPS